jgi:dolichyl-phosphate-mannose--protein O-mannosyl transferase
MKSLAGWMERFTPLQMALLLAVVAELLFAVHLGQPNKMMFDETHYVPAARTIFGLLHPANEEHPLLAKWLIGLSMAIFGDNPAGWRALSTLAGVATMLSIYAIALKLFGEVRTSATAALLAMINQMLFIQARIAMLEVFAGAFLFMAIALLVWGRDRRSRGWIVGAGICLGLSVGCKWSALPLAPLLGLGVLTAWPTHRWRAAIIFGLVAAAAYVATFAPALFFAERPLKLDDILLLHRQMLDLQTNPLPYHTYQSTPWQWPLITRPIWYLYEKVEGVQRGVLLLGNPAVMWGGLIALAFCLWDGVKDRQPALLALSSLYIVAMGAWIVIPKKIGFYYYYYFPGLILPLLIAAVFHHSYRKEERWLPAAFLLLSFGLFVYFYPIISAEALPNDRAFEHWMWLSTWP